MTLSAVLVIVAALLVQTSHGGPGGGQDLKSLGEKIFQKVGKIKIISVIRSSPPHKKDLLKLKPSPPKL